jgi:hypothetical protein
LKETWIKENLKSVKFQQLSEKYNIFFIGQPLETVKPYIFAYLCDDLQEGDKAPSPHQIISVAAAPEFINKKYVYCYETKTDVETYKLSIFEGVAIYNECTPRAIVIEFLFRCRFNILRIATTFSKLQEKEIVEAATKYQLVIEKVKI